MKNERTMCWLKDEYDPRNGQWYAYYACKVKKFTLAQLKSMPAPECRDKCEVKNG